MANPTKRVYWDACVWIALIQREKILLPNGGTEDRETMSRMVVEAAKKGTLEILTSTFCLVEVCRAPGSKKNNIRSRPFSSWKLLHCSWHLIDKSANKARKRDAICE